MPKTGTHDLLNNFLISFMKKWAVCHGFQSFEVSWLLHIIIHIILCRQVCNRQILCQWTSEKIHYFNRNAFLRVNAQGASLSKFNSRTRQVRFLTLIFKSILQNLWHTKCGNTTAYVTEFFLRRSAYMGIIFLYGCVHSIDNK